MSEEKTEAEKVTDGIQALKDVGWVMALMLPVTLLKGVVASHLWSWFAVPIGAPALGIMQMSGVTLLVSMIMFKWPAEDEKRKTSGLGRMVLLSVMYLLMWGMGAIFHVWMT